MKKRNSRLRRYALPLGVLTLVSAAVGSTPATSQITEDIEPEAKDSIPPVDTLQIAETIDVNRLKRLTDADYKTVAKQLQIPVAAIKAVVHIEAGPRRKGFNKNNTPIISFDLTAFKQAAKRRGVDIEKYRDSHPDAFNPLNKKKFGSTQAAEYARLNSAMSIDSISAMEGTYWGMFQIAGFNWKLCKCESVFDFVDKMYYSEVEHLKLFAAFMKARRLVKYIQTQDWEAFSLRYNGPGFKKHSYDTRLAAAYEKFLLEDNPSASISPDNKAES